MKVLVVLSYPKALQYLEAYRNEGEFKNLEFCYLIEFFEQEIPKNLPANTWAAKNFADVEEIDKLTTEVLAYEGIEAIFTDDEFSIYISSRMREKLNLPGVRPEQVIPLRDKVRMKEKVSALSTVKVPQVYTLKQLENGEFRLPLVAKPRAHAGSTGVSILQTVSDVNEFIKGNVKLRSDNEFRELDEADYQVEEFIEGEIFHVDGLYLGGEVIFASAGQYVGTCVSFYRDAKPLGSVMIEDESERLAWKTFAAEVLQAIELPQGAFHLEAFKTFGEERVFMEVAARPGGAGIVPATLQATGVDLRLNHLLIQLGSEPRLSGQVRKKAGWLIYPKIFLGTEKTVIESVNAAVGALPTLVRSRLPSRGDPAYGAMSYFNNNGEFMFCANSAQEIYDDLHAVLGRYSYSTSVHL